MLQSLYNTEISEARVVGYCRRHHCYLSGTQLKRKECLEMSKIPHPAEFDKYFNL